MFRHRDARRLWCASAAISAAGWMLSTAVTVHVLGHGTAATLAMVALAGSVPTLLVTPIAGTVADRADIRKTALLVVAVQVVSVGSMAAATAYAGLAVLAALYALQGAALAFWAPLRQQWLYAVLPREMRAKANAAFGSLSGLMTVIGAAGGGLVSAHDPVLAMSVAGLVLCLGLIQLLRIAPGRETTRSAPPEDKREPAPSAPPAGSPSRSMRAALVRTARDLRDGIGMTRSFPLARSVIWLGIAWGLIGGSYTVLLAGHVLGDLHGDSAGLGFAYAVDGFAVIVATVLAGRLPRTRHLPVWAISYAVQGAGWVGFFLVPSLPTALACLVLMRIGSGYVIALDTTILLETVQAHFRGRVTSVHITTYTLMARISLGVIGWILTSVSLPVVGVVTGVLSVVFGAVWWWRIGRTSRQLYQ